jgi:hypothetical protein
MIATWVPAKLTPLTFDEAASAMRLALAVSIGKDPTREVLALALAKTALETAHWKSIYAWNFGNVKAGATYAGNYCCISLNEVIGGKVVWFSPRGRLDRKGGVVVAEPFEDPPGHPQTRMRAYSSAAEGARAYVAFVASGRYAAAWKRLLAGDAVGYVTLLRQAGYFTAPLDDYIRGVVGLQRQFLAKLAPAAPLPITPPDPPPPVLRLGASGHDVIVLQEALNRHAKSVRIAVDGKFGKATEIAVKIFQQSHGLRVDAVVGPATWRLLLAGMPPAA